MRIPKRLMPHTVTVANYEGAGTYGDTWGARYKIKRAYCEDKQQQVVNDLGEQVLSSGFVIVDPEWSIPLKSRVTVQATTSRVVSISHYRHPSAPSHQVLYLGGA